MEKMKDLIERQKAIDAAIEAADEWDGGYSVQRTHMIEDAVKTLPSAQPEIIRCGECSFFKSSTSINGECVCNDMWMSLYGETTEVDAIVVHKDHYCGYAERRTDEDD